MTAVNYKITVKGGIRGESITLAFPKPLVPGQVIRLQDDFEWHVVFSHLAPYRYPNKTKTCAETLN